MPRRVAWLRAVGLLALLAIAALAGALAWLFGTPEGLAWALEQAGTAAGGRLGIEAPRGTLAGGFEATRVRYEDGGTRLEARDVYLRASLLSVVLLRPEVAKVEARTLELSLPEESGPGAPARSFALPVPLYLDRVRIDSVTVKRGASTVALHDLRFAYRFSGGSHRVTHLRIALEGLDVDGQAMLGAEPPFAVRAALGLAGTRSGVPFKARLEASGDLGKLGLHGRVEAKSAVAELQASFRPSDGLPPESLALELRDVDLHAFDAALPQTRLQVSAQLARSGQALAGRVSAANALAGRPSVGRLPLVSLDGTLRTDLHDLVLSDLTVRLGGAGRLAGRVDMTLDEAPKLEAQLGLSGVDLSQLADLPASELSGEVRLTGTLAAVRRVSAEFSLVSSRLAGRSLAGVGRVQLEGDRVVGSALALQYSGASVQIDGAFGGPADRLTAQLAASDLSLLDAALSGRASLRAEVTGGWRDPVAHLSASGFALAFGTRLSADRLELDARVAADPARPLHVAADLSGAAMRGLRARQVRATVDGTRERHTISLGAQGDGFDFAARLAGGMDGTRAWAGKLVSASNRGTLPFSLEGPAALRAAPRQFAFSSLALRFEQGRVQVGELSWDDGRLATRGALSDVAVVPLLRLVGWHGPLEGNLALGAEWSLTVTQEANGSFRLWRKDGDLEVSGKPTLPLGLTGLEIEGHLTDGRLQANGRLAASTGNGEFSVQLEPAPDGAELPYGDTSRLEARLEARIASLAPFGALIDPSARVEGSLEASLEAHGTLAQPALTGDIASDGIRYARPPDGIDLVGGRLRAQLQDDALHVSEFRISGAAGGEFSAHGTLVHGEAQRAAIAWSADKLALLNRPDHHLVVSGQGAASMDHRRLSISGALRADSGYFSFQASGLPRLGDDVVIAGRERAQPKEQRIGRKGNPSPVDVDLQLDLGRDLRIRGRGLDTGITGKVHVYTDEAGVLNGKGTVHAVRGTVTAYGTRLAIERGRLMFDGPLNRPSLDILAMRRNQEVAAGVAVTGSVQNPTVRIVSEPPVPEGEALSWLVLGRAPGSGSGADLALLQTAAGALLGQDGKGPAGSLAHALGVDTLSVGGSSGLSGQFLTVGKRINDRVMVFYEQALGATGSVLRLDFELSRLWALSASTGQQSDVGLRFRYSFD
jgi:translocation and assembly module TamB